MGHPLGRPELAQYQHGVTRLIQGGGQGLGHRSSEVGMLGREGIEAGRPNAARLTPPRRSEPIVRNRQARARAGQKRGKAGIGPMLATARKLLVIANVRVNDRHPPGQGHRRTWLVSLTGRRLMASYDGALSPAGTGLMAVSGLTC